MEYISYHLLGVIFLLGVIGSVFKNLSAFAEFLAIVLRVNSRIGRGYGSINTPPACPCLAGRRLVGGTCPFSCL